MNRFLPGKLGEASKPDPRSKEDGTGKGESSSDASRHKRIVVPIQLPDPRYSTLPERTNYPIMASAYSDHYFFVEQHFAFSQLKLPIGEGRVKAQVRELLTDQEKMFLSKDMIFRYLRATEWNNREAIKRLEATLVWRREHHMDDIDRVAEELKLEFNSGKVAIVGYSKQCQPILYFWPYRNTRPHSPDSVRHMMFMVDRLMDLLVAGAPGVMFGIQFAGGVDMRVASFKTSLHIINSLQAHFPERLGVGGLLKVGTVMAWTLSSKRYTVDIHTRTKLTMNPKMTDLVEPEQLLEQYGGRLKFEWNDDYLPGLIHLCKKRRKANLKRWQAAGGVVGLSEWNFLEPMPKVKRSSPAITLSPPTPEVDDFEYLETIPESPAEDEPTTISSAPATVHSAELDAEDPAAA